MCLCQSEEQVLVHDLAGHLAHDQPLWCANVSVAPLISDFQHMKQ